MKYGYVNKFTSYPGKREDLMSILLQAAEALKSNDDCLHYLVSFSEEPEMIYVTEVWTSKQAHDAALEPEGVKATIAQAMPLINSVNKIAEYQVQGGKGLN